MENNKVSIKFKPGDKVYFDLERPIIYKVVSALEADLFYSLKDKTNFNSEQAIANCYRYYREPIVFIEQQGCVSWIEESSLNLLTDAAKILYFNKDENEK